MDPISGDFDFGDRERRTFVEAQRARRELIDEQRRSKTWRDWFFFVLTLLAFTDIVIVQYCRGAFR